MRFVTHFFWAGSLPLAGASNSYVLVTYYLLPALLVIVPGNSDDQLRPAVWWHCGKSPHRPTLDIPSSSSSALPASGVFLLLQWLVQRVLPSFTENPYACRTGRGSVQFSSVAQPCLTLCDPKNHSTPGLPVHHQLPESTQTHVHCVSDAISPSVIPFSSCPQSFPASGSFQMSQLSTSGGQSTGVSTSTSVPPKAQYQHENVFKFEVHSFEKKDLNFSWK